MYPHLLLFFLNLKYFYIIIFPYFVSKRFFQPALTLSLAEELVLDLFFYQYRIFYLYLYFRIFHLYSYFRILYLYLYFVIATCARFVACWGGEKATLSASSCFDASTLEPQNFVKVCQELLHLIYLIFNILGFQLLRRINPGVGKFCKSLSGTCRIYN